MASEAVTQVRRFNRTVTQRVGALDDRFLSLDRPLAEARLLWEIGPDECEVRALRRRLELDSGHASRLLRSLEGAGLVAVVPGPADRRVRVARLTARGRAERERLDARSEEWAESMLASLDDQQQERLVGAMRTVERLLTYAEVEIRPVDPNDPDARQCLRAYFAELDSRAESGYDPAAGVPAEPHELSPPVGCFLVAYLHGEPIACGGVKHATGAPAHIRRMWVSPSARGLGLGRRLLHELEARAVEAGATTAHIETGDVLTEALALYRSEGYVGVPPFNDEPFADHWLEKRLRAVEA
jgi:DNA-binding MarR family transcriptional regulator/GNAT superfamily N-acetyltransferase